MLQPAPNGTGIDAPRTTVLQPRSSAARTGWCKKFAATQVKKASTVDDRSCYEREGKWNCEWGRRVAAHGGGCRRHDRRCVRGWRWPGGLVVRARIEIRERLGRTTTYQERVDSRGWGKDFKSDGCTMSNRTATMRLTKACAGRSAQSVALNFSLTLFSWNKTH